MTLMPFTKNGHFKLKIKNQKFSQNSAPQYGILYALFLGQVYPRNQSEYNIWEHSWNRLSQGIHSIYYVLSISFTFCSMTENKSESKWRSTKVYLKVSNSRWNEVTVAGKIERPIDISTGVVPGVVAKIDPNAIN